MNTYWQLVEKIIHLVSALVVGGMVANFLGPAQFGLISYSQSVITLFICFSNLGIESTLVRDLINSPEKNRTLLGTAFALRLLGATISFILIFILISLSENTIEIKVFIGIISLSMFFQSFGVIDIFFQAKILSKYVATYSIIKLCISSILKISFIYFKKPIEYFIWLVLVEVVLYTLLSVFFYNRYNSFEIFKWSFDKNEAKRMFKNSWPIMLSTFAVNIYMRIDQIIIKEFISENALGQYVAAIKISEAFYFIPVVLCSSLLPAIISAKKDSEFEYYKRLQFLYTALVWISICLSFCVTISSDYIIDVLYGKEFSQSSDVLKIHIWASVFVSLGVASGQWLVVEGLEKLTLIRTIIGLILNLSINLIFLKDFGFLVCAYSALISQIFINIIFDLLSKKLSPSFRLKINSFIFRPYKYIN
jgi:O-antigen/teichoic acid export membrane protein